MKNFLLMPTLFLALFTACMKEKKGCTAVNPKDEEPQIVAYASANAINATKHLSGIYYEIISAGTGATPTINSKVSVTYTGKLLNGTQFDQATAPISFSLAQVIEGWQIGIPLIQKGGRIKLIIPSSYGYGCNGYSPIPGNAVLFFDVTLTDVQ
jgi:FKBP-type peptidyl-prolyl cis-trans isomerase